MKIMEFPAQSTRHFMELKNIPLFTYERCQFVYECCGAFGSQCEKIERKTLKDAMLMSWERAKNEKVFNYDLKCSHKLVRGDYNFSIQLNTERAETRRKPAPFHAVREPFDATRWNFTKLSENEILFRFCCKDMPLLSDQHDQHILAINAAPLEHGHSLILPSVNRCLPQILNEVSIHIAVHFMLLVDDNKFHVLFNSLLGLASVNHLHLHAIFWPYEAGIVNKRCDKISIYFYIIRRPAWCSYAIVFQLTSADQLDQFVSSLLKCVEFLSSQNIAHNVFFARSQPIRTDAEIPGEDISGCSPQLVTAYVFPRISVPGAKRMLGLCPASLELGGCLTAYDIGFYQCVSEEAVLKILDEDANLPSFVFDQICRELDKVLGRKQFECM